MANLFNLRLLNTVETIFDDNNYETWTLFRTDSNKIIYPFQRRSDTKSHTVCQHLPVQHIEEYPLPQLPYKPYLKSLSWWQQERASWRSATFPEWLRLAKVARDKNWRLGQFLAMVTRHSILHCMNGARGITQKNTWKIS